MATQTLEFVAGTGLTLSCKLFALGSDTVVDTQTATEKTNDKNRYAVAFSNLATGFYRLNAFVGAVGGFANEVFEVKSTTGTYYPRSEESVWESRYAEHTTAGTFGKVIDTLRKANTVVDGVVTAAVAATTTSFSSNVNYPTGAFEHAVLLWLNAVALNDQNSPILTYVNTNGVITVEEAFTSIPQVGDEFIIIPTTHVHAVADIQAGLALEATSQSIKAKTDLITAGQVQIVSPVGAGGNITTPIFAGDDYKASNGRAFEWTIDARTGFAAGTATCRFGGYSDETGDSWNEAGTVTDIGGGEWKLSFDLTKTVTSQLAPGFYRWSVEIANPGGDEVTEVYNSNANRQAEVRAKQT